MFKIFIGLGILLFVCGTGAIAYGLPYLVLEYGFTVVISGIVSATGGLILIGIGVLLKEMQRVSHQLSNQPLPVLPEPAPLSDVAARETPAPEAELPGTSSRNALTAGAVLAAGGAALAATRLPSLGKMEQALGDVIGSTRGEQANEGADSEQQPGDASSPASYNPSISEQNSASTDDDELQTGSQTSPEDPLYTTGAEVIPADVPTSIVEDTYDGSGHMQPAAATSEALDEPQPELSSQATHPVSSDEGIIRVYTIGAATFTMYSDGTIRARTPTGSLEFATMEDLKLYLDDNPNMT